MHPIRKALEKTYLKSHIDTTHRFVYLISLAYVVSTLAAGVLGMRREGIRAPLPGWPSTIPNKSKACAAHPDIAKHRVTVTCRPGTSPLWNGNGVRASRLLESSCVPLERHLFRERNESSIPAIKRRNERRNVHD